MRVFAFRPYLPSVRRVYQPAAVPSRRSATPWVFCFAYGRQGNYAAAHGGEEDVRSGEPVVHCLLRDSLDSAASLRVHLPTADHNWREHRTGLLDVLATCGGRGLV